MGATPLEARRQRCYWVVIDENGKQVDNVKYIDHEEAEKGVKRLTPRTRLDKFYRLRAVPLTPTEV